MKKDEITWELVKEIYPKLTKRKCEVLSNTFLGLSEEEVANKLFITRQAIRSHKSTILKTLGVKDKHLLFFDFISRLTKNNILITKEKFDSFAKYLSIEIRDLYERKKNDRKSP